MIKLISKRIKVIILVVVIFLLYFACYKIFASYNDMILIPEGEFVMGASGDLARGNEFPKHKVKIFSFWIDRTEVTNKAFQHFVNQTGHKTSAELSFQYDKNSAPKEPGSLVFLQTSGRVPLDDPSMWWNWIAGANWQKPLGPNSTVQDILDHPVVHVSWQDASEFCKFYGKRLPTEAEWEWAARGKMSELPYSWGHEPLKSDAPQANTWDGNFPYNNTLTDGYLLTAPIGTYPTNGYGLSDMAGNVWEWVADWYDPNYYQSLSSHQLTVNPRGAELNQSGSAYRAKVIRGGSYLCNVEYCESYRVSARMFVTPDTTLGHLGFRCAKDN